MVALVGVEDVGLELAKQEVSLRLCYEILERIWGLKVGLRL